MSRELQYFIDRFSAIPYEDWFAKDFMIHLNSHPNAISAEGYDFIETTVGFVADEVARMLLLYMINDGEGEYGKIGSNPKDRWIRWLEALKRKRNQKNRGSIGERQVA